jgi:hypothetical protein
MSYNAPGSMARLQQQAAAYTQQQAARMVTAVMMRMLKRERMGHLFLFVPTLHDLY